MKFWSWLLRMPAEEDDGWQSTSDWKKERTDHLCQISELLKQVYTLEKEVCHWKSIALNFKKFHQ